MTTLADRHSIIRSIHIIGPRYYYPNYWNYNTGYPNYYPGYNYAYGYPYYGWYPGTAYPYWDPTAASHPYSKTNPNWIPYVGWR